MEALGEVESDDEIAENAGNFEEKDPDLGQAEDAYHDEKKKIPVHFEVTLQVSFICLYRIGLLAPKRSHGILAEAVP